LIDSRCESRSSKGAWPSTLRSVVCDISEVALRKFSTFTDGGLRIDHAEINNRVDRHRHVVARHHLLPSRR
jgi:hypothetical protein